MALRLSEGLGRTRRKRRCCSRLVERKPATPSRLHVERGRYSAAALCVTFERLAQRVAVYGCSTAFGGSQTEAVDVTGEQAQRPEKPTDFTGLVPFSWAQSRGGWDSLASRSGRTHPLQSSALPKVPLAIGASSLPQLLANTVDHSAQRHAAPFGHIALRRKTTGRQDGWCGGTLRLCGLTFELTGEQQPAARKLKLSPGCSAAGCWFSG